LIKKQLRLIDAVAPCSHPHGYSQYATGLRAQLSGHSQQLPGPVAFNFILSRAKKLPLTDGRDSHWNILVPKQGPINPQVAGNMPDVARGYIFRRKRPLALSLAKPRQKDEDILKTYELFIHGNTKGYYSLLSIIRGNGGEGDAQIIQNICFNQPRTTHRTVL
jgi:hypothetical protein